MVPVDERIFGAGFEPEGRPPQHPVVAPGFEQAHGGDLPAHRQQRAGNIQNQVVA